MAGLRTRFKRGVYYQGAISAFLCLAVTLCLALPSVSDDFSDRRITAGARIFRALLAADVDIVRKVGSSNTLRLCLLYTGDTRNANMAGETLRSRDDSRIRKLEVTIDTISFDDYFMENGEQCSGVFLTETLNDDQINSLMNRSNDQGFIVFSPIEGDVERGVQSGLAVEARVRPYLNMNALQAANIQLKSFILRVAKQYEE